MSRDYVLEPFRPPIDLQIDYGKELNAQQHEAVTAPPGPSLVIAGAGSGKTRTLIYRVAFLLEQGIPPDRILLLTFTNKAAREMMGRVADLIGGDLTELWGGTFHSIGNRILRRHADRLGYPRDFTILDREDTKDLIHACMDGASIHTEETRFPKPDLLGDIFSLAINTSRPIQKVLDEDFRHFSAHTKCIQELAQLYQERKRTTGVMDFDDLLVLWLRLLKEHADLAELYQRRFQFILVDEYQDTNLLQGELIDLLASRHHNIMVVGDDSQSIYSWRGANFHNILDFPKRYPEAKVYKIETNYRSTPEILTFANAAIAANTRQFPKTLAPVRKTGIKPVVVPCHESREQAAFIAQRVLQLRDEGIELHDMAVLYRSHFHALEVQFELTRRNIPFSITSGIRFFEQAHIKDVASFLRLVANPRDELAFKRLVRLIPGIGGRTAEKLWASFQSTTTTASPATASTAPSPVAHALQTSAKSIPKKAATAWAQLVTTLAQLEAEPVRNDAARMIQIVLEAVYDDYLQATYTNYRSRLEDLEQLALFARQFTTLSDFLSQLSLLTHIESEDGSQSTRDDEKLRLSTIHQAKGLEFRVVFVIMLCDGLFPSAKSMEQVDREEEERRLFYVAVTRAKDELYLSYPLLRSTPGDSGEIFQTASRFLGEIPNDAREELNLRPQFPFQ